MKSNFISMLILCSLFCISFSAAVPETSLQNWRRADGAPSRAAWALVYYVPEELQAGVNPGGSDMYTNIHTALEIASDDNNAQLRVQIRTYNEEDNSIKYVVDVVDVRNGEAPLPIEFDPRTPMQPRRKVFPLEQKVTFSNQQMVDPTTGKGVIAEIWGANVDYNLVSNNCNDFVTKLAAKLGLTLPDHFPTLFQQQVDFYKSIGYGETVKNVVVSMKANRDPWDGKLETLREFDVTDPTKPVLVKSEGPDHPVAASSDTLRQQAFVEFRGEQRAMTDFFNDPSTCFHAPQAVDNDLSSPRAVNDDVPPASDFWGTPRPPSNAPSESGSDLDSISDDLIEACTRKKVRRDCTVAQKQYRTLADSGVRELVVTRNKGSFKVISIFDNAAVRGVGLAAAVAGVAFIILDFLHGDFRAATLGLAGLALGVAAEFAVGGPVGILVGAAVGALFAILPGLFDKKPAPPANNPAQIIQWAFFGDRDHTGNEKCNSERQKAGLEANCTVLYGAGVISKSFDWEVFDAVAFLVQYNQGHAMSILDMANVFHVIDKSKSGDGMDKAATIECGNQVLGVDNTHRWANAAGPQQPPSTGLACQSPKFAIKRNLITFPFVNATADAVYKRIIPSPNGDCKVLSDPSEGFFVAPLNLTLRGRPVAVACGLKQDSNLAGVVDATADYYNATPLNSTSNGTDPSKSNNGVGRAGAVDLGSGCSNSSSSCDNNPSSQISSTDNTQGRAYQAAPPPSPFAPLTQANSTCLIHDNSRLCLPSGQYSTQTGKYGFKSEGANGLLLPAGANFTFNIADQSTSPETSYRVPGPKRLLPQSYTTNVTGQPFSGGFAALDGDIFNIKMDTDPSCVCLFSDTNFKGDTQCFGIGGGNLTGAILQTTKSVSVHGNVTVWVYAQRYDDKGGALLSLNTGDLSEVPYGDRDVNGKGKDNFSQKIVALWVKPPRALGD